MRKHFNTNRLFEDLAKYIMTDLARKRAIRAGHRGVITKLTKKADSVLNNDDELEAESSETRLQTINTILSDKLKIVKEFDEQVFSLCEVEDISREIEEADDIISRVLDIQTFIAESRRKSKLNVTNTIEQNVVNIQTTSTNSNSEGLPTNASIEEPNSQVTELQAPSDTGMSNTSGPLPNSQGQVNQNFVEQSQQLNAPP